MKQTILFLFLVVFVFPVYSQTFRGRVTSGDGTPLPYAALYLREINSGFVADDNGYFRATVDPGTYICEISSLGYNKQIQTIIIPSGGLQVDFVLSEYIYQLKEVQITQSKEDPAVVIMRKVIANAPRYRYQLSRYTAETYLKGSGKLTDIPPVFMLSKEVRAGVKKYMNRTFLLEEERKVTYTAPDNWDNEVVAYSNTFPDEITVMLETTDVNLYTPKIFGKVSPLSTGAFNYYSYALEGCVAEGKHLINKIKVIPKKDNPELVSGYLYVVEDLWCLSALKLSFDGNGIKADAKVNCNEVEPSLFLTTSISFETVFNFLGIKAEAAYSSSIKYREVDVATNRFTAFLTDGLPEQPVGITQLNSKQQTAFDDISKLVSKEELTTREAYRLSRLLEKSMWKTDSLKPKHKYERKPYNYQLKTDSLAAKRDSLYWENVRSIPLTEEELASYAYKKSFETDSVADAKKGKNSVGKELLRIFLRGRTYQTNNKNAWITFKNFWSMIPEYNLVDGLWVGTTFEAGVKFNEYTFLKLTPRIYYATGRETWLGGADLSLSYAPRRMGELWISSGSFSEDFNSVSGESRLINSYSSELFGRNYVKFYNRKYLTLGNRIELANSLLFSSTFNWERRSSLDNSISEVLFGKNHVTPNIPDNAGYVSMPDNHLLKVVLALSYTPAHYYRMIHGRKIYENSSYPTIGVQYQQAFNNGGSSTLSPSFKKAELFAEQRISFGLFNNLYWRINGGIFWDKKDVFFSDFNHFAATRLPITARAFYDGFFLIDNYRMSTDSRWAQAHVTWSTPYLLIKQLPFLKRKTFDEALHLHALFVDNHDSYMEAGYSVGIMNMGRVGVFAGFSKFNYHSIGISVSIPLLKILGY